jgi:transcriptional regulator with XRE-family HTH domain
MDVSTRLGHNVRFLRETRGATQAQMARLAELPRATWAHVESGAGNPTLSVLDKVAAAFQVTLEELVARPRPGATFHPRDSLPTKLRGVARIRKLLPDALPGTEIDRFELPRGARIAGVPHTAGTREYLTCESGRLVLVASGESYTLSEGDVVAFRGDQKHSYANPGEKLAVAYSVVVLAR